MRYFLKDYQLKSTAYQILFGVVVISILSIICFFTKEYLGYRTVALILLMGVSVLAILVDYVAIVSTSFFSAFVWNFCFIPPVFTLRIEQTEDILLFAMYFVVALVNGTLNFKIREAQNKIRDQEEHNKIIELYNTVLNSLSHELKTPLATIYGSIDILRENSNNLTEENNQQLILEIDNASKRLKHQLDNLLNMSRLESGTLKAKNNWEDINDVIFKTIEDFKDPMQTSRIEYENNPNLPLLKVDRGILTIVLSNLIDNGLKYSPQNTKINIKAEFANNKLNIVVDDEGPGIPKAQSQKVFE